MKWTNRTPPFGVWAYSVTHGLFMIKRKMEGSGLLEVLKVGRFESRCLETQTIVLMFAVGPFVYPMPDPTEGVKDETT
jgi:hypothetical protein